MPQTFHIRNRTYTLDAVESIVIKYEHFLDKARELVEKHKLDAKLGDNFIDIALDNLEELIKHQSEQKLTTNLGTTIYLRYNEDDSYVYLAIRFRNGVPVANHPPIGDSTIVQTSSSPTGPWLNGSFYTS